MASVQPAVTVTCDFGSIACPVSRSQRVAMAFVNSGTPPIGAYWLGFSSIARLAASLMNSGPSKSGKPCPRFTAWASTARVVISAKMVVPKGLKRSATVMRGLSAEDERSL